MSPSGNDNTLLFMSGYFPQPGTAELNTATTSPPAALTNCTVAVTVSNSICSMIVVSAFLLPRVALLLTLVASDLPRIVQACVGVAWTACTLQQMYSWQHDITSLMELNTYIIKKVLLLGDVEGVVVMCGAAFVNYSQLQIVAISFL